MLRGRIHHFQRMKFPDGVNTGKGKPVEYTDQQAILIAAALHLNLAGMGPERAVELLRANRASVIRAIERREPCQIVLAGEHQTANPALITFEPHKLAEALGV